MSVSPLDAKMRDTAKTLITKYGKTMTLVSKATGTYDVATGEAVVTPTLQRTKGVFTNSQDTGYDKGSLSVGATASVMVAAKGLTKVPDASDSLTIDGASWKVLAVGHVLSGEQVAYYLLDISK